MSGILAEAAGYKAAGGCIVDDRGGALRYYSGTGCSEAAMAEIWKSVIGYEGVYEVSDHGRVKRILAVGHGSRAGRILKQSLTVHGYPRVALCKDGKSRTRVVHALVAEAFLGPRAERIEVNHIDGNKENPAAVNLEYVTRSENGLHSYRVLGRKPSPLYGAANHASKLTHEKAREIRRLYAAGGVTQYQLADQFGVTPPAIGMLLRGRTWITPG